MSADTTATTRWHARVAHATAVGTVPWQSASLAAGLVGLASLAIRGPAASAIWLSLSILHALGIVAGLWLSLRLRIDAALFRALAEGDGADGLDRAMVEAKFVRTEQTGRTMPDRVAGLLQLARRLALVVAAQLTLLVLTGWVSWR